MWSVRIAADILKKAYEVWKLCVFLMIKYSLQYH